MNPSDRSRKLGAASRSDASSSKDTREKDQSVAGALELARQRVKQAAKDEKAGEKISPETLSFRLKSGS